MSMATILPKERYGFRGGSAGLTVVVPSRVSLRLPRGATAASVPVPGISRDIQVKFASTRQEWEEAFQLVADNYQACGYEGEGADCRFTDYHALPDTVVLVAKAEGRVVATFSLVPDNAPLGLPLESLYRPEIQALRHQGRRLFETGSLADRGLSLREFLHVFPTMMRLGWQYQVGRGADTTVITVNPRHTSFYTKLHGFLSLGPRRSYDAVQGHPAEAFYLNPETMASRAPEMYRRIFGEPLPASVLAAPRMPEHLVYYFAARSSRTRLATVKRIRENAEALGSSRRW